MDEAGTRWIDALPDLARERLPAPVWHYFAAGSGDGTSAAEAATAWRPRPVPPHALRDVTAVDTSRAAARHAATPSRSAIAPTSLQRAADPEGERAMARAVAAAGVPHGGLEQRRVPARRDRRDRAVVAAGVPDRRPARTRLPVLRAAADAGAARRGAHRGHPGRRHQVRRSTTPTGPASDLSWHRGNFAGHVRDSPGVWARDVTEADVEWLAETTGLPVVVKGVLRPDDARRCVEAGAAAVWVSNHGGRQLDRAAATADCLPAVADEVGGEVEVYVDGGVRIRPRTC